MTPVPDALLVPGPPHWTVDWDALDGRFEWIAAMRGVPQDPVFHAEGDVWIHTRMVCESMANLDAFRAAPLPLRTGLFAAALLHDVAKPRCTVHEPDGRIRSPGHSPAGANDARGVLWRLGMTTAQRESVCAMIRYHQVPYHWASRSNADGSFIRMSQTAPLRHLAWLAHADLEGRICEDQAARIEDIALFEEYAHELGCAEGPWSFANDHSRAMYFARNDRDPHWAAHDDTRFTVTLMSGLPGSGKSTWVAEHAADQPIIELDAIRRGLGIPARRPQGKVIHAARERAREYLRRDQPFVWDATNLSRRVRRQLVSLFYDYGARVRIVHVEAPAATLRERNRSRPAVVPDDVLTRMIRLWEPPDRTEAHEVVWVVAAP
ncbi:MAG: AAA family ATPase [Deltaproteobacteria bacterium]|nr:AAA family ATPase [Deltaproteobacteria bacterium]